MYEDFVKNKSDTKYSDEQIAQYSAELGEPENDEVRPFAA